MSKNHRAEEQKSLQTVGSQQATDVGLYYCGVRPESLILGTDKQKGQGGKDERTDS